MESPSKNIVLYTTNFVKDGRDSDYGNDNPFWHGKVIGPPQPTDAYSSIELQNMKMYGSYKYVTEKEIEKLLTNPNSKNDLMVFDYIGEYPKVGCYDPKPLSYVEVDGSEVVKTLSHEEYGEFVASMLVLPLPTFYKNSNKNIALYRKRKLI